MSYAVMKKTETIDTIVSFLSAAALLFFYFSMWSSKLNCMGDLGMGVP